MENLERGLCQMLCRRWRFKQHRFVVRDGSEEFEDGMILPPCQKGVVPGLHDMLLGNEFDLGEVHDHAFIGRAGRGDDRAGQRDLDGVAVAVQMPALAAVVRDAVTGVEFQSSGDAHGGRIIPSGCSGADQLAGLNRVNLVFPLKIQ